MPREALSSFLFNVQKWRGSRSAQRMSFSQRGVYLEMMFEQWEKRFLKDDPQAVADAIATTPEQVAEVLAAWPVVRPKFIAADHGSKRIYNAQLERTRREQTKNFKLKQEAGRVAGLASARKRKERSELSVDDRSTTVQRPSTDKSSKEESSKEEKRRVTHTRSRLFGQEHREHAACGRACVPAFLHRQFLTALGGDEDAAYRKLLTWYSAVEDSFAPDDPVPADVIKFWRARFDAEFVKPSAAGKSDQQQADELAAEIERQNRAVRR